MNFNDTIVNIDILDEQDMIDIEVSDDHFFYGDGILVSNSIGIPAVCDFTIAGMRSQELDALGQIALKQLKNRYRDMTLKPKFILGVELSKQTLYDISDDAQTLSVETASNDIDMKQVETKFKKWKGKFDNAKFSDAKFD